MSGNLRQLLVLVIPLALAGCAAPIAGMEGLDPASEPPARNSFAPPVVMGEETRAAEPRVLIASDGTILVCAPRGVLRYGTLLWRSTDGGATFEHLGTPTPADGPYLRAPGRDIGGGDCDLAVDAAGTLYMVDLYAAGASIAWSHDDGDTWDGVPLSVLPGNIDRPWIAAGDAGEVFLTAVSGGQGTNWEFYDLDTPPVGGLVFARSTDGGRTFLEQTLVVDNARRMGLNGNLARDGDHLFIPYSVKTGPGRVTLMVAASDDRGKTWDPRVVVEQPFYPGQCFSPVMIFPIVATDGAGGVYLTWTLINPETGRMDLHLAHSLDLGKTWTTTMLADRQGQRYIPWVAAKDPGIVGLAWYETESAGRLQSGDLTCTDDTPSDAEWFVRYAEVDVRSGGTYDIREERVDGAPVVTGVMGGTGEFLSLDFDLANRPGVAYMMVGEDAIVPMYASFLK